MIKEKKGGKKVIEVLKQNKDLLPYIFFGICTTLVNISVYWLCAHAFGFSLVLSTVIAWILSVLFAYITNRKCVFYSVSNKANEIVREIISFFSCRLLTGFIDLIFMFIFVDILKINDMLIKMITNILVIVLNYVASKFWIFKK